MDVHAYKSMEQCLIEEVRKRPEIYDKSTAAYRMPRIRDQAWKEIANELNITDIEVVKKRWSTLRDTFIKIQRNLKYNPKQVVKWVYYKQFLFLIPHVESKMLLEEAPKPASDETQDTPPRDLETDSCSSQHFVPEEVVDVSFQNRRKKKRTSEEDPLAAEFNLRKNRSVFDEEQFSLVRETDADEQFLLSCLPALKRLKPRDNAIARLRIQQVMLEVEFGEEDQRDGLPETKVEANVD